MKQRYFKNDKFDQKLHPIQAISKLKYIALYMRILAFFCFSLQCQNVGKELLILLEAIGNHTHVFILMFLSVFHKILFFTSMRTYLQNSFSKQFVFSIKNILQSFRFFRGQINILQIFKVGQKLFSAKCQKAVDRFGRPLPSPFLTIFQRGRRSTGTVDRNLDFLIGRPCRSTDGASVCFPSFRSSSRSTEFFGRSTDVIFRSTEVLFRTTEFSFSQPRLFQTIIYLVNCAYT